MDPGKIDSVRLTMDKIRDEAEIFRREHIFTPDPFCNQHPPTSNVSQKTVKTVIEDSVILRLILSKTAVDITSISSGIPSCRLPLTPH